MSSCLISAGLKSRTRRELKHRWELISHGGKPEFLRERLQDNLRWWLQRHPGIWASYRPLSMEADPLIGKVAGIDWVFPRIENDRLVFASWGRGQDAEFTVHRYGMEEPPLLATIVEPALLTGMLIPGLGFDRFGGRLGRGAGFYDRTLHGSEGSFKGLKVGIAYGFQMMEELPMEPHDVRMDVIVTDQTVIECGGF
ncbi:MAG: 5-formyltetrahydrofolate cyclo-ligase [Bdellovibrionaceae bacterium]|nr:5-formyltetrahydrofolate cyclo-ligase [Pseudobdellovibrionaceae bacterium]